MVTRGGRFRGCWKEANQDAFSLSAPAEGALLACVCDGHGHSGELASRAAADGLAAALPGLLASGGGTGGDDPGSRSDAAAAASQLALVAAFQHVGGGMRHHPAFAECGAAVAACLVQRGRCVWACKLQSGRRHTRHTCPAPHPLVKAHVASPILCPLPSMPELAQRLQPPRPPTPNPNPTHPTSVPLLCSLTVAWAGDCRATIGLCLPSPRGPRWLVHPLTQDHKPGRWARAAGLHVRLLRQVSSRACFVGAMTS